MTLFADEYRAAIARFIEAEPDIPFNLHKDLTKILEAARNWTIELERRETELDHITDSLT